MPSSRKISDAVLFIRQMVGPGFLCFGNRDRDNWLSIHLSGTELGEATLKGNTLNVNLRARYEQDFDITSPDFDGSQVRKFIEKYCEICGHTWKLEREMKKDERQPDKDPT